MPGLRPAHLPSPPPLSRRLAAGWLLAALGSLACVSAAAQGTSSPNGPTIAASAPDADTAWAALARQPGHLIIMRHALAPGVGDPPGLRLGTSAADCATQRNLSDEGRAQARAVGERLRRAGLQGAAVYSSQWCRTLDTARGLGLGAVRELPALNSFFGREQAQRDAQMRDLRTWIARADLSRPVVLVTHQVVMTALTGEYAASAEALVLQRGRDGVKVVGRFATPY